jgi:hypothetical protein
MPYVPNRKTRYPSVNELEAAVAEVVTAGAAVGVSPVLVGGLAMQIYGSRRLTTDVDVAALRGIPMGEPIKKLGIGGVRVLASNGVPIDVIVRGDRFAPLFEEAIAHAVRLNDPPSTLVVLPEYLVAMKMIALRSKDADDLGYLLAATGVVDLDAARDIVLRHLGPYAVLKLDRALRDALLAADAERDDGEE